MGNSNNKPDKSIEDDTIVEDEAKAFSAKRNKKRLDRDVEKETASLVARAKDGGVHKIVETINEMNESIGIRKDLAVQNGLLNALCGKAKSVTEASENTSRLDFHAAQAVISIGSLMQKLSEENQQYAASAISHTIALCCETCSCIAKIRVQKKYFVVDGMHIYILEALKIFNKDEKIVFWGVNALYHMSRDGPNIIVPSVKAIIDLDIGAHSLTLETLIATNAEVSGKAVFDGAIVFHAKVVAPGAEINPAGEKKSWFQISSSGSKVSIIGQTKGHIIYVTNIDTTASHTISESGSLVNINRKSTAQFIFTGAGWSRHVDASSSGGGRRRLMKASHEDYDGFSKQKSIEKLKAFQEIDNVPSMDYFQVDSNNIFLRRTKGSKIVLPQASGSGHVIRLYIQNDVQLDKKHTISCPNENVCTFNGNLIVYNEDADSPSDYMSTYTCNGKSLTVGVLSGGLAGGFVEFTDMDFGKWLVNGNLRIKSLHHTSINPCV